MCKQYKHRAMNLSDTDIDTIVRMLDGWVGELTWYTLIDAIKDWQQTDIGYTRQALHNREPIYLAYLRNKKRLNEVEKNRKKELRKRIQAGTCDFLKSENARWKAESKLFIKQLVNEESELKTTQRHS